MDHNSPYLALAGNPNMQNNDTPTAISQLDFAMCLGIAVLQLCFYHTFSVLLMSQIVRRVPIPQFMQPLFMPANIFLSPVTFGIDGVLGYFYSPTFARYVLGLVWG